MFKSISVRWKVSWRACLASAILVFGLSGNANAHGVGIGDIVDGTSATIWYASWHTENIDENQGDVAITGPDGFNTTLPFDQLADGLTPAADWTGFDFEVSECIPGVCVPATWQGLALAGLAPGTYNYVLSEGFSGAWAPEINGCGGACTESDYTGSFAVTPIPAALPLLLSGLAAFGFIARRRRSAATA